MKAAGDEELKNCDEEAISHYNLCDCLDVVRKIQFMGLVKARAHKKLLASLKARILTLVIPKEGYYPKAKMKQGTG